MKTTIAVLLVLCGLGLYICRNNPKISHAQRATASATASTVLAQASKPERVHVAYSLQCSLKPSPSAPNIQNK